MAGRQSSTLFTRIKTLIAGPDLTAPILIGDLYEDLENDYIVNGRRSLPDLKSRWRRHLARNFSAIHAVYLTTKQISAYVSKRQAEGAANATINRELALLKRCILLAIRNGRLKAGERCYFPMLREKNVRSGFVRDTQYVDLARTTAEIGPWLRGMFELGFTYGWRVSELRGLRVSHVDMEAGTIRLDAGTTKNDEGRLVFMTIAVRQMLGSLVAGKAPEDRVFTRATPKRCSICSHARLAEIDSALDAGVTQRSIAEQFEVSASAISRHANRRAKGNNSLPIGDFRKHWKQARERAGCPGLLFHDLRRSGVRNLIRAGVSEKTAMKVTGHLTNSVFKRYQIVDEETLRQASALLDLANGRFCYADPGQRQLPLVPRKPAASCAPDRSRIVKVAQG